MPLLLSVNSLANGYADRTVAHQDLPEARKTILTRRAAYDFKVTGVNVAFVIAVTCLFLAVITTLKLFFVAVACVALLSRASFLKSLDQTGMEWPRNIAGRLRDFLQQIGIMHPNRDQQILRYTGLEGVRWEGADVVSILDLVIWKAYLPKEGGEAGAGAEAGGHVLGHAGGGLGLGGFGDGPDVDAEG